MAHIFKSSLGMGDFFPSEMPLLEVYLFFMVRSVHDFSSSFYAFVLIHIFSTPFISGFRLRTRNRLFQE